MRLSPRFRVLAAIAAVAAIAIPLPLFFLKLRLDTSLIGFTAVRLRLPFELFGFTSAALILGLTYALRGLARDERSRAAYIGLALIALYASMIVAEVTVRSGDYIAYENAARALLAGRPVYGHGYLYPPLLAIVLAGIASAFETLGRVLHAHQSPDTVWICTFYTYQVSLFFAYVAAAVLTLRQVIDLVDRSPLARVAFVVAIFIVNDGVLRAFERNQINFALLALILATLALIRRPVWAGLMLALAVHLKIYPLLLLVPLFIGGQIAICAWALVFTGLLGGAIALVGGGIWHQFFAFLPRWPRGVALRDDSIHSLLFNTADLFLSSPTALRVALAGAAIASVAATIYLLVRQTRLAALLRAAEVRMGEPGSALSSRSARRLVLDALPFLFLVSPMVWEHHWVLLLPFVATRGFEASFPVERAMQPDFVVLGSLAAILATPTFDLYPFSYCRLLGLLVLIASTHPRAPRVAVLPAARAPSEAGSPSPSPSHHPA